MTMIGCIQHNVLHTGSVAVSSRDCEVQMNELIDDGFELFQHAIMDHDTHAWAQIHQRYRVLLIAWARQSSVANLVAEQFEDIADQALARAWAALTPARFAQFPSLPAVLGYLRNCVATVLIDMARAQATRDRTAQRVEIQSPATPEQVVLDGINNTELWQLVTGLIETPQETIIIRENIVLGLPPRVILARHFELFSTISEVYTAKRNLIGRLQRNMEIQRFADQMRGKN
jgi:DNA-directed RNA polymerase specialized sigma24 family protein